MKFSQDTPPATKTLTALALRPSRPHAALGRPWELQVMLDDFLQNLSNISDVLHFISFRRFLEQDI